MREGIQIIFLGIFGIIFHGFFAYDFLNLCVTFVTITLEHNTCVTFFRLLQRALFILLLSQLPEIFGICAQKIPTAFFVHGEAIKMPGGGAERKDGGIRARDVLRTRKNQGAKLC